MRSAEEHSALVVLQELNSVSGWWDGTAEFVHLAKMRDGALEVVIKFEAAMVQSPQVYALAEHCASLVVVMRLDTLKQTMVGG